MKKVKCPGETLTEDARVVIPSDTNPYGNLHGGTLLHWMDSTGAICAHRHCESPVLTVAVSNVFFKRQIRVGDIVILRAKVTRAFKTSVEVKIDVFVEKYVEGERYLATTAYFVYVAIDREGKPREVPQVQPQTPEEIMEYENALKRREFNLSVLKSNETHANEN